MQDAVPLFVSVPVTCFRVPRAREHLETLPCPPPSTVYGMLLSLAGETNRHAHEGAKLAVALLSQPEYSVVLRTLWRVKSKKNGPGLSENKRPDFQELLTNVKLAVWVRQGKGETAERSLADRVYEVIREPQACSRFGGLSLGESTHLIDEIRLLRNGDPRKGKFLVRDEKGILSLPIWPDHVGSVGTRWDQFSLMEMDIMDMPDEKTWVTIQRDERNHTR
jgi:CRISPR-associated protein Cas5t